MNNAQDPDYFRFRDYAEGNTDDSPVDLSGREGYDAPLCPGYNAAILGECGNERDEDKELCDDCQDSADLDAREESEARAWGEGEPVAEMPYPHLADRE